MTPSHIAQNHWIVEDIELCRVREMLHCVCLGAISSRFRATRKSITEWKAMIRMIDYSCESLNLKLNTCISLIYSFSSCQRICYFLQNWVWLRSVAFPYGANEIFFWSSQNVHTRNPNKLNYIAKNRVDYEKKHSTYMNKENILIIYGILFYD